MLRLAQGLADDLWDREDGVLLVQVDFSTQDGLRDRGDLEDFRDSGVLGYATPRAADMGRASWWCGGESLSRRADRGVGHFCKITQTS